LSVFGNRELRRIFGSKRRERGDRRKMHKEETDKLYSLPNIITVIKSGTKWNRYVRRIGERKTHTKF
jgi:hypothetical protein